MDTAQYEITERPIGGSINTGDVNTTEQISATEFLALVDKLLDLPRVVAVVWDQYTPYFNDGDACTFGIYEARIKFDFGVDESDEAEDEDGYSSWDLYTYTDNTYTNRKFSIAQIEDTMPYYKALQEFDGSSSSWEMVAKLSFGDHAEVTATKAGFNVEYYEHD